MAEREPASVLMLTADRQIDRRILLERDSLEKAGWRVTIVGAPVELGEVDDPPGVRRVQAGRDSGAAAQGRVIRWYAAVRRRLPMNGVAMRLLKSLAWRFLVDLENFYTRLYAPTITGLRADVVVAHDLPMLPVAVDAAARRGAKLVYDSHELFVEQDLPRWLSRRWRRLEASLIGRADAVITVNESIARELERRYGLARVHVILNAERALAPAARAPTGRLRAALGLPASARVLLYQGGLISGRNLDALVDSMARVQDRSIHLVMLGDGRLRDALERRARKDRVHFLAAVPQHELLGYSVDADAGVVPYRAECLNNYFCSPNKLFEFIAAGIPVLGSDLPEIARFVRGHDIGLLVADPDADAFAAAIDEMFADPQRLAGWRANAARAAETVCWASEADRLVQIYESLR